MRHDWKIVYMAMKDDRERKAKHAMQYKHRVCQNCAAEQMQDAEYERKQKRKTLTGGYKKSANVRGGP